MNNSPTAYYFGYGFNINPLLFKKRLKDVKKSSTFRQQLHDEPDPLDMGNYILHHYKFSYDLDLRKFKEKGTAGTVTPVRHHMVYGVLYRITEPQLKRLDRSEEVPRIYQRILVTVCKEKDPDSCIEAWIDIAEENAKTTKPEPENSYVDEILKAAYLRQFPETYIDHYLRFPPRA